MMASQLRQKSMDVNFLSFLLIMSGGSKEEKEEERFSILCLIFIPIL